jgi:dihydropyrimidinase
MTFPQALEDRLKECQPAMIDYSLHMMVTDLPRDPDETRRWLIELRDLGVPSIKLYTTYRPNYYADDATMLHTFRAMPKDMIAMVHCENDDIVTDATRRLVEAGKTSRRYHGVARPPEAEVEAIHRVIYLAHEVAKVPVYIVHCSTQDSVWSVYPHKGTLGDGKTYFCETCPQYFMLDDSRYEQPDAERFILQPPLRPKDHQVDLLRFIADNLSAVSTDHCDYTLAQKQEHSEFTKTPGGLPGLETSFQLTYTHAVHSAAQREQECEDCPPIQPMPLTELARLMSTEAAKIFGLYPQKGAILPGADADLLIYDPSIEVTIRTEDQHTIGGYTPYEGMNVQGKVRTVLSRGKVLVEDGEFNAEPGQGQFLRGKPFVPLMDRT